MGTVRYRFRAEARRRGWAWTAIAVLAGLFFGSIVAAVGGGQRTNTVVARALEKYLAPDVFMVPSYSINGELLNFDKIRQFPEVAEPIRVPAFPNQEDFDVAGFTDPALVSRGGRLLEGRVPNPRSIDEATASFVAREKRHVHLGDTIALHLVGPAASQEGGAAAPGPLVKLKIVGITESLADFASIAGAGLNVTPAFIEALRDQATSYEVFFFVLKRHEADLRAFRQHMGELTGGKPVLFVEARNDNAQIQRTFHVQAVALWMLAMFLGLVTTLIFAQTLARQTALESDDHPTLSALGMSRHQQRGLDALRALFIGLIAALAGSLFAICVSTLLPFGHAGLAEPSPGWWAPAPFLVGGFFAILSAVVLLSLVPSLVGRGRSSAGPSRAAPRLAAAIPWTSARVGTHFALEPGRGGDAVPVRSSFAGTTIGVLALVMSLTVSASLAHLLRTPRLYGWGWDTIADIAEAGPDAQAKLEATEGVAQVSYGNIGAQASVGRVSAELVSMEPGPIRPVLLEGRSPIGANEVALGRKTLRDVHARRGSSVDVSLQGSNVKRSMRVVGVVVLPVESDVSTLGEGILVAGAFVRAFDPTIRPDVAFVRYQEGADRARTQAGILALVGGVDHLKRPTRPSALLDFGHVRSLPLVLAGLLGCLSLATVAHVLISAVRRRRRDLAVLKTMGFVTSQVRAVIVWHALILSLVSLAIGIPLGIAAGRWVWVVFARYGGFVPETVTPISPVMALTVGAIALASALAWPAGRAAARTRPATVLHSE